MTQVRMNIQRHSTARLFVVLLALFLVIGYLQATYPIGLDHLKTIEGGAPALDTQRYQAGSFYQILGSMSEEARVYYRRVLLTTDLFFPILYRIMLIVLGTWALKWWAHSSSGLYLLALLPISSMLADIFENGLIALSITLYPGEYPLLATLGSILTRYKWRSNQLEWIVIGSLILLSVVMRIRRERGKEAAR